MPSSPFCSRGVIRDILTPRLAAVAPKGTAPEGAPLPSALAPTPPLPTGVIGSSPSRADLLVDGDSASLPHPVLGSVDEAEDLLGLLHLMESMDGKDCLPSPNPVVGTSLPPWEDLGLDGFDDWFSIVDPSTGLPPTETMEIPAAAQQPTPPLPPKEAGATPPPPLSPEGALELWDMLMLIMYHQIWLKRNEYKYRGDKPPPAKIIANSVWNLMELSLRGVLTELATVSQWWVRRADLLLLS